MSSPDDSAIVGFGLLVGMGVAAVRCVLVASNRAAIICRKAETWRNIWFSLGGRTGQQPGREMSHEFQRKKGRTRSVSNDRQWDTDDLGVSRMGDSFVSRTGGNCRRAQVSWGYQANDDGAGRGDDVAAAAALSYLRVHEQTWRSAAVGSTHQWRTA